MIREATRPVGKEGTFREVEGKEEQGLNAIFYYLGLRTSGTVK
jgi:hypothetical protein